MRMRGRPGLSAALSGIAMPNQGLSIKSATSIETTLSLTYVRDPRYDDDAVQAGLAMISIAGSRTSAT